VNREPFVVRGVADEVKARLLVRADGTQVVALGVDEARATPGIAERPLTEEATDHRSAETVMRKRLFADQHAAADGFRIFDSVRVHQPREVTEAHPLHDPDRRGVVRDHQGVNGNPTRDRRRVLGDHILHGAIARPPALGVRRVHPPMNERELFELERTKAKRRGIEA
jgi:hypothetical protein